jgi:hypothetical protein
MVVKIYIGADKLDLFKDENISLTSSVASINDISKNTTDFTQSFTVPASDINNNIFKHYYNATLENGFDARTPVAGTIEIDGLPFKNGKFTLTKVALKSGSPTSYTINFTGNLVSIKDKVRDDTLAGLDLSAYDHTFNSANVETGLTNELFSGDLKYAMFGKKQYYYNKDSGDNTNTDVLANIAWDGGADVGVLWSDLKPCLKIARIVEAIATKYDFNFSNDFFGDESFEKLYMWLNNSNEPVSTEKRINFSTGDNPYFDFGTDEATYPNNITNLNYIIHECYVLGNAGFTTVPYTINIYVNNEKVSSKTFSGGAQSIFVRTEKNTALVVHFTITTSQLFEFDAQYTAKLYIMAVILPTIYRTYATDDVINSTFFVNQNMPNIKVIDFLKGLFSMFKLVVIANEYNDIYVNTFVSFYADGGFYDVTKYVNFESTTVERGNLLNEISFKFQEPTTLLNSQFLLNTGEAYGDEIAILEDAEGNKIEGSSFTLELPFEQFVYERLIDLNDDVLTNIQYAGIFNEQIEAVVPAPHICYLIAVNMTDKPMAFIDDTNTKTQINSFINITSHKMTLEDVEFSTIFGAEFSEWNGEIITNSLYNLYYDDYINAIFNIKRRSFSFTAFLPVDIMTKLKLNDVLKIKEDYYRIDNYNLNLLTGETRLNLINSFDNTITI